MLMRYHRSLKNLVGIVNPGKVANRAEDYLEGARLYGSEIRSMKGLVSKERIKALIKKIDMFERDILRLEEKIDRVKERRRLEGLKLEDYLLQNLDVLKSNLEPDEFRDFK